MFGFGKKKKDNQMMVLSLKHNIKEAFTNMNKDIDHIKTWVNHLASKNHLIEALHDNHIAASQKEIENVNRWIYYLHQHNQELQTFVREVTTNLIDLHNKDAEILKKIEELETAHKEHVSAQKAQKISEKQVQVRTKSGPEFGPGPVKTTRFEEKVMYQLKTKRKDYIIQKILGLINEKKYSTKEIEHKIVKEMSLCGRTTFYDYLKELRNKGIIDYREKGARKILVEIGSFPD